MKQSKAVCFYKIVLNGRTPSNLHGFSDGELVTIENNNFKHGGKVCQNITERPFQFCQLVEVCDLQYIGKLNQSRNKREGSFAKRVLKAGVSFVFYEGAQSLNMQSVCPCGDPVWNEIY